MLELCGFAGLDLVPVILMFIGRRFLCRDLRAEAKVHQSIESRGTSQLQN
jgi:hypothetical protein